MGNRNIELSDVILDIAAGPFGSNLKKSCFQEDGFPIIDGANLKGFKLTDNITKFVTEEKARSLHRSIAKRNDVIVTISGTLGQISYIPEDSRYEEYLCSQRQFRVTFDTTRVYVPYLVFFFHTYEGQNKILSFANQVGVPALAQPLKNFRKIKIDLPEIEEQKKIASIVELLNKKIENNDAINNNLLEQIQAIYAEHFKGTAQEVVPISALVDVRDGTHDSPKPQSTGRPLITSKHLLPFGVDKTSTNLISEKDYQKVNERSVVNTSDILLSMIGTVGLVSFVIENPVDFAIKNVGLFKTSATSLLVYYIHCYLLSSDTQQLIERTLAGSTQKYISLTELRKMPITNPSATKLKSFNDCVIPLYKMIISNIHENLSLTNLRDSLLPKLLFGELDISNIDI